MPPLRALTRKFIRRLPGDADDRWVSSVKW
jgi:hypothetical protein